MLSPECIGLEADLQSRYIGMIILKECKANAPIYVEAKYRPAD